jgi:hypothetical protein
LIKSGCCALIRPSADCGRKPQTICPEEPDKLMGVTQLMGGTLGK